VKDGISGARLQLCMLGIVRMRSEPSNSSLIRGSVEHDATASLRRPMGWWTTVFKRSLQTGRLRVGARSLNHKTTAARFSPIPLIARCGIRWVAIPGRRPDFLPPRSPNHVPIPYPPVAYPKRKCPCRGGFREIRTGTIVCRVRVAGAIIRWRSATGRWLKLNRDMHRRLSWQGR
jgi:hypothetical protein